MSFFTLFNMTFDLASDDNITVSTSDCAGQNLDILDRNWQTTAAIGLGCATAGVGTVVTLAVMPATTLGSAAAIGALAYAGHRRHNGLSPLPSLKKKDEKTDAPAAAAPAAA